MFNIDEEEGVLTSKIITGSALFVVSILFGIAPFKLAEIFKWSESIDPTSSSNNKSSKVVSALLCFGGGVLLSTTFLHLLPEINSEIQDLQNQGKIPILHINTGEFLMLCGFFLIFLIEEIVHYYLHRYQERLKKSEISLASTMKPEEETIAEAFMRGISARDSINRRFSVGGSIQMNSRRGSTIIEDDNNMKILSVVEKGQHVGTDVSEKNHINQMNHNNINISASNKNVIRNHSNHHNHAHSHTAVLPHSSEQDMLVSSIRGLLIVLALSIHELFEGFAVGLQKSSYGVYYMFSAVCAHKFVISFCIGVEFLSQKTKFWLAFIYIFMYSIVSALGILIGAALTTGSHGEKLQVPNVILQGFATGTLLYVTFFEVLSKNRSGIISYLSIFCGFVIMLILQYIASVTESHQHGEIFVPSTLPEHFSG